MPNIRRFVSIYFQKAKTVCLRLQTFLQLSKISMKLDLLKGMQCRKHVSQYITTMTKGQVLSAKLCAGHQEASRGPGKEYWRESSSELRKH